MFSQKRHIYKCSHRKNVVKEKGTISGKPMNNDSTISEISESGESGSSCSSARLENECERVESFIKCSD